jgi:hypothetical protein
LKDEICIAVGQFYLHKDINDISPRFHILAPFHQPFTHKEVNSYFEGFKQHYQHPVDYFFGYRKYEFSIFKYLDKKNLLNRKDYFHIDYSQAAALNEDKYHSPECWDITGKPFAVRTVIYSAIQIALYMGCKEIYLLGCDHDYLDDFTRVTNHHFYPEASGVSDAEHLGQFTTERWFEEYFSRWRDYRLIRQYAKEQGAEIYNATAGGRLDVFPRVELSGIFQG